VEKEIRAMQSLTASHPAEQDWVAPIVKTTASTGEGTEALFHAIEQHRQWLAADGRLEARRLAWWRERIELMLRQALLVEARAHGLSEDELAAHAQRAAAGTEDPYRLIPELVARVFGANGAGL
jgi:LAO/AO transport system kinase